MDSICGVHKTTTACALLSSGPNLVHLRKSGALVHFQATKRAANQLHSVELEQCTRVPLSLVAFRRAQSAIRSTMSHLEPRDGDARCGQRAARGRAAQQGTICDLFVVFAGAARPLPASATAARPLPASATAGRGRIRVASAVAPVRDRWRCVCVRSDVQRVECSGAAGRVSCV